jgi:hypothetical protein
MFYPHQRQRTNKHDDTALTVLEKRKKKEKVAQKTKTICIEMDKKKCTEYQFFCLAPFYGRAKA